jgi:hypothetical protein
MVSYLGGFATCMVDRRTLAWFTSGIDQFASRIVIT